MRGRSWGIWTTGKLEMLRRYLDAFTTASKRSSEIVYLDLFAGQPDNYDRSTGEPIPWSAKVALDVENPGFTRLRFFELRGNARHVETTLNLNHPDRDAKVYAGDSNETITDALAELYHIRWAPTFAFIDPNGPHFWWHTLVQLANHRPGEKTKIELFLLLPVALFTRTLRTDGGRVTSAASEQITRMYGTEDWRFIYRARLRNDIEPREAREQYVNLMRWRLETDLGYRYTHPFEVFNDRNRSIYHMVFATDHPAGTRIMNDVYRSAAAEFPAMRAEARRRRRQADEAEHGVLSLFDSDELARLEQSEVDRYEHEAPIQPWWLAQGR